MTEDGRAGCPDVGRQDPMIGFAVGESSVMENGGLGVPQGQGAV